MHFQHLWDHDQILVFHYPLHAILAVFHLRNMHICHRREIKRKKTQMLHVYMSKWYERFYISLIICHFKVNWSILLLFFYHDMLFYVFYIVYLANYNLRSCVHGHAKYIGLCMNKVNIFKYMLPFKCWGIMKYANIFMFPEIINSARVNI